MSVFSRFLEKAGIPITVQKAVTNAGATVASVATGGLVKVAVNAVNAAKSSAQSSVAQMATQLQGAAGGAKVGAEAATFWQKYKLPILFGAGGLALATGVYVVARRSK